MRGALTLLLLVVCGCSHEGPRRIVPELVDEAGVRTYFHPDGAKKRSGAFSNGHEEGEWTEWYGNGKPSAAGSYVHSARVGRWTFWWPNGLRFSEGEYVDGAPHGVWARFHEDGTPDELTPYDHGQRVGQPR